AALVVYNPLSTEREDVVEAEISLPGKGPVENIKVTGPDGKAVVAQVLERQAESTRIAFLAHVPSMGFAVFSAEPITGPAAIQNTLRVSDHELENESYIVKLDAH